MTEIFDSTIRMASTRIAVKSCISISYWNISYIEPQESIDTFLTLLIVSNFVNKGTISAVRRIRLKASIQCCKWRRRKSATLWYFIPCHFAHVDDVPSTNKHTGFQATCRCLLRRKGGGRGCAVEPILAVAEHLNDLDRTFLALSCKSLAYCLVKCHGLSAPFLREHCSVALRATHCPELERLVAINPHNGKIRLCCRCLFWRPRKLHGVAETRGELVVGGLRFNAVDGSSWLGRADIYSRCRDILRRNVFF